MIAGSKSSEFGKFVLTVIAVFAVFLLVRHGATAMQPTLPKDMPGDSRFVYSGFDIQRNEAKGDWIACRTDSFQQTDYCRVTDSKGTVIFQGDFLPVNGSAPEPASQLRVSKHVDPNRLWVQGPAEASPVPVIPLENGTLLVPAPDTYALADRWSTDPDELRRVEGN